MAKQLQLRGGTTAEHAVFTGADRELTVDTDKNTLVVHDGITAGGFAVKTEAEIDAKDANVLVGANGYTDTEVAVKRDIADSYDQTEVDSKDAEVAASSLAFSVALG